jgi:hypothetical protein
MVRGIIVSHENTMGRSAEAFALHRNAVAERSAKASAERQ